MNIYSNQHPATPSTAANLTCQLLSILTVYLMTGQSSSGLDGYGGYTWGVTMTGASLVAKLNSLYD